MGLNRLGCAQGLECKDASPTAAQFGPECESPHPWEGVKQDARCRSASTLDSQQSEGEPNPHPHHVASPVDCLCASLWKLVGMLRVQSRVAGERPCSEHCRFAGGTFQEQWGGGSFQSHPPPCHICLCCGAMIVCICLWYTVLACIGWS